MLILMFPLSLFPLPLSVSLFLHSSLSSSDEEFKVPHGDDETVHDRITYNMRKSLDLDVDGCILVPGEKKSLLECGFNVTAKTIFIIHGWTVKTQTLL